MGVGNKGECFGQTPGAYSRVQSIEQLCDSLAQSQSKDMDFVEKMA